MNIGSSLGSITRPKRGFKRMEIKRAGSKPSAKGLREEVKPYNIRTTVISA
jgi:hypothetical protein